MNLLFFFHGPHEASCQPLLVSGHQKWYQILSRSRSVNTIFTSKSSKKWKFELQPKYFTSFPILLISPQDCTEQQHCLHGGTCYYSYPLGKFTCTCVPPFFGNLCEHGKSRESMAFCILVKQSLSLHCTKCANHFFRATLSKTVNTNKQ